MRKGVAAVLHTEKQSRVYRKRSVEELLRKTQKASILE